MSLARTNRSFLLKEVVTRCDRDARPWYTFSDALCFQQAKAVPTTNYFYLSCFFVTFTFSAQPLYYRSFYPQRRSERALLTGVFPSPPPVLTFIFLAHRARSAFSCNDKISRKMLTWVIKLMM